MNIKYQGSEEHKKNARIAVKKGLEAIAIKVERLKIEYYKSPKKCKNCDNNIPYEKKNRGLFCSRSCSGRYNNIKRGKHTEETNKKISEKLTGRTLSDEHALKAKTTLGNLTKEQIENRNKAVKKAWENPELRKRASEISKNRVVSDITRKKISDKMQERIKNGVHKGWSKRNIPSYPEKFFMKVLNNNNIEYEFEKKEGKYFIDFAILNKKIALEIDGSQHKRIDRKESDIKKDIFLKENGWVVYRIEWKSINTVLGKEYIKNEIDKFICYYNYCSIV